MSETGVEVLLADGKWYELELLEETPENAVEKFKRGASPFSDWPQIKGKRMHVRAGAVVAVRVKETSGRAVGFS